MSNTPMQNQQQTERVQLDPGLIKVGLKLHAFALDKVTHLRGLRGGRQTLARFALQHPTTEDIEFPPEWSKDPKVATRILDNWLKVPGNPYNPTEEELETATQEPEENILIGPSSLRSRKKNIQDMDELKESLKLVLIQVTALKAQSEKISAQNKEIKTQYEGIRTQNEEIKAQYKEIKEQYASLQATLTLTATKKNRTPINHGHMGRSSSTGKSHRPRPKHTKRNHYPSVPRVQEPELFHDQEQEDHDGSPGVLEVL